MKVLCPACDRLIDLERFHVEGTTLVVTCGRCEMISRVQAVDTATSMPTPAPATRGAPRVTLSSDGASNVLVLRSASHDAVVRAAQAAVQAALTVPDDRCPRCIAPRTAAANCPQCGISYAVDPATFAPPAWLDTDWRALLGDWGSESRHQALREKARRADALADVGRLYRVRLAVTPDDPFATNGLSEVLRLAAMAIALRPDDSEARKAMTTRAVLVSVVVVLVLISALLFALRPTN